MFCLDHQTYRHSPPVMKRTFEILRKYLQKHQAVETVPGRDVKYSIPNVESIGIDALMTGKATNTALDQRDEEGENGEVVGGEAGDEIDLDPTADEEVEVEDDGDLEV